MESNIDSSSLPIALSIAGSDSGGIAGAQADLLTFAANGVFGTTALTCVTAQNPVGISAMHLIPEDVVEAQIRQIVEYYRPKAVKTGMLFSAGIIARVCQEIESMPPGIKIVVDPVMVASSGQRLLQEDAVSGIQVSLLPLATVVTPNLDEAEILLGRELEDENAIGQAAIELAERYGTSFLIKGGHLAGDELFDILGHPDGSTLTYRQRRIHNIDTHGSGCTLSAAIAAGLAKGEPLDSAIELARAHLRSGMESPLTIRGTPFIDHLPR